MSVTRDGDATALAPTGDLDVAAAATLEQAATRTWATGADDPVLLLRGIDVIHSTGLRVLLDLRSRAERNGRSPALVPSRPGARRIFRLTGTHGLSDRRPDRA